jgi:ADP-ribosylglycohydrolase
MLGAIVGDIVGSIYEYNSIKTTQFPLFSEKCFFTDDTVLTVALADSLLTGKHYRELLKEYYQRYPDAGFGCRFIEWAKSEDSRPYGSWGNGAAMRISPIGWICTSIDEVLIKAEQYTAITHNHPEGIKGAQATAAAVFMGRNGCSKDEIRNYIATSFGYDLTASCDAIRPTYSFDVSCRGTMPPAITAFLESTDFESSIRLAVSLGGDADTLACITGCIAEAFYGGVPAVIAGKAMTYLDDHLKEVTKTFLNRYVTPSRQLIM